MKKMPFQFPKAQNDSFKDQQSNTKDNRYDDKKTEIKSKL